MNQINNPTLICPSPDPADSPISCARLQRKGAGPSEGPATPRPPPLLLTAPARRSLSPLSSLPPPTPSPFPTTFVYLSPPPPLPSLSLAPSLTTTSIPPPLRLRA